MILLPLSFFLTFYSIEKRNIKDPNQKVELQFPIIDHMPHFTSNVSDNFSCHPHNDPIKWVVLYLFYK